MLSTVSGTGLGMGAQFTPPSSTTTPPQQQSQSSPPAHSSTVPSPASASASTLEPAVLGGDPDPLFFFRTTPIPTLVLDASLTIRQVSQSYLDVSGGCGRDQLLGFDIYGLLEKPLTLPSLPAARKAIQACQDTHQPYTLKQVHTDGTTWAIRTVPIYSHDRLQYIQMEITDITEEQRRLLELEEKNYTNETFRILVETVKDYAIFMLDPQGYVATWNAGAHKFKGYTKDEIIGKHFSSFYGTEDRENDKPGRELADALRVPYSVNIYQGQCHHLSNISR